MYNYLSLSDDAFPMYEPIERNNVMVADSDSDSGADNNNREATQAINNVVNMLSLR